MEPIKEFTLSKKMGNQSLYMGGVALAMGLVLLVLAGNGTLIGFGILFMIIGATNRNLKIVKLYPQYLEIKLGIIAPKKLMKYDQITSFSIVKKTLELHYNTQENKSKKVKILVKALEKDDLLELDKVLQEKTDLEATNTFILTDVE
ncbi:hypothetical protein [Aquimarina algiphila]|uniref:Uncharacterized protein n=1 Tax=Aquimarina algiphila TaxID=2047982 RepID=A0A554VFY5_9FLAO|nr:hypothetical protein [Aquimarina algiphila]TSE06229.1 hypothetical protein FOF46_20240 [Aquimarina algiphila]